MDATYAAAGQFLSQLIVELLDVRWLDLSDPLFSKAGADMVFDIAAVSVQCAGANHSLHTDQPLIQPLRQSEPNSIYIFNVKETLPARLSHHIR